MIVLLVLGLLLVGLLGVAYAHQSGCHRWHSCPSDTGSYVCGDAGYACRYPTYDTNPNDGGPGGYYNPVPVTSRPQRDEFNWWPWIIGAGGVLWAYNAYDERKKP